MGCYAMIGRLSFSFFISIFAVNIQAQTCNRAVERSAEDSRYFIMANGEEILDLKTRLVWMRCSLGQSWSGAACTGIANNYSWQAAFQAAKNNGGDWRLPDIQELQSLVEVACYSPAINDVIFPGTVSDWYWASTSYSNFGRYARGVGFYDGWTNGLYKSSKGYVRLVRFE